MNLRLKIGCTFGFLLLSFVGQAQVLPHQKLNNEPIAIDQGEYSLANIKKNIDRKKACYSMAISVSLVEKPINNIFASGPELGYAMATLKQEGNSLRGNSLLLRSGNDFSGTRGNRLEIVFKPKPNGAFDPNQVKITWRFPDLGTKTFFLENVDLQGSTFGLTLTGDAMVDGKKLVTISMAIGKTRCFM